MTIVGDWDESERPDLERRYATLATRVLELIRDCPEAIPLTRRVAADILAKRSVTP